METRRTYHHGDLRAALMQACLDLIEAEGIGAVSLRKVARAAGVSPGAPYHHFEDRSALLAALSTRGFELLGEKLAVARAASPARPVTALHDMLMAYLAFAQQQPAYFGLMFRPELSQPDRHPDTHVAADATFAVVADVVADCVRERLIPAEQAEAFTLLCWSVGHGLTSLVHDGMVGKRAAQLGTQAEVLIAQVAAVFTGLLGADRL